MLFNFQLRPVTAIAPFGSGRPTLHWFGLSDGWYWLDVAGAELFRYRQAVVKQEEERPPVEPDLPYADYYVARLWEDVLDILPAVLDPVPEALALRLDPIERWRDWQERAECWLESHENDASWDVYLQACGWWAARRVNVGYLQYAPRTWFWRVGETLHICWDNRNRVRDGQPVWTALLGEETMPIDTFLEEIHDFDTRFISAMAERITVAREHWPRPDILLDVDQLEREQRDRAGWLSRSLGRSAPPPQAGWNRVLEAIAHIESDTPR